MEKFKKKIIKKSHQNYSKLNIPSKYILFVGRLSIIKGPDILLEAFIKSKIKNEYNLIFAGPDDNMRGKMEKYIKKSPNNKKSFIPWKCFLNKKRLSYEKCNYNCNTI